MPSLLSRGRDYPGEDMDAPIEFNRRRTLIEEHARHYPLSATIVSSAIRHAPRAGWIARKTGAPSLLSTWPRLHRWRHRAHIQNTLQSRPASPSISAPMSHPSRVTPRQWALAQWLLNLRILYNCYSIIGVRKVATSANCEAMWCSWQVVSYFVDTLTDLATANIPGTKMRPNTGVLQLAELNLRTRVVEIAQAGC